MVGHLHPVPDTDVRFVIDPITRKIQNKSGKTALTKGDHNSERFTFEINRHGADGHDLSLCNVVQVHYTNTSSANKSNTSKDCYIVKDLQISPDDDNVVIFSWLIHRNATKYAGTLDFSIKFKCLADGVEEFGWGTPAFRGISVSDSIDNTESVEEEHSDALGTLQAEFAELKKNGIGGGGNVGSGSAVRQGEVELLAANWLDGEPDQYYQIVKIDGTTERSMIAVAPDAAQILVLNDKAFTIHFENDGGVITAFATGDKPTLDYVFQVHITEVAE